VLRQVDLGVALDLCPGVAAVGEGARDRRLRVLVRLLFEGVVDGEGSVDDLLDRLALFLFEVLASFDADLLDDDARAFFDLDRHLDVIVARVHDAACACLRFVEAARLQVALDPLEIALEHAAIEQRVVVHDAAKEPEELLGRHSRHFLFDVRGRDDLVPLDGDVIDGGRAFGNRRAGEEGVAENEHDEERDDPSRERHGRPGCK
jgi:hypothetical protein